MKKQLLAAALALALAFTLGCEEKKSTDKAKDSTEPVAAAIAEPAKVEETEQAIKEQAKDEEEKIPCSKAAGKVYCNAGEVKLLKSAIYCDDFGNAKGEEFALKYDEQNRIVKIYNYYYTGPISSTKTITYNADLITIENVKEDNSKDIKKFVIKENTITHESDTLILDEGGNVVELKSNGKSSTYQYKNGNLTTTYETREYDNKKSPFSNTNTPKWLFGYLEIMGSSDYLSKNNILKYEKTSGGTHTFSNYEYEYDDENFPIKLEEFGGFSREEEIEGGLSSDDWGQTRGFTYYCKGDAK